MVLIADYCPQDRWVRQSSHGLKSGGIGQQKSTPSRPTEKTFKAVQIGFIQEAPPSWGCVQHYT